MSFLVIDTCVFVRLTGEHKDTLTCIKNNRHVISICNEAVTEYQARFKPSKLLLLSFLQELEREGHLKHFKTSFIEARVRRIAAVHPLEYPQHVKDRKWIDLGVAVDALYIISNDSDLLDSRPNHCSGRLLKAITPESYNQH